MVRIYLFHGANSHSLRKTVFNKQLEVWSLKMTPLHNYMVHCRLVPRCPWSGQSHHRLVLTSAGLQVVQDVLLCPRGSNKAMKKSESEALLCQIKGIPGVAYLKQ